MKEIKEKERERQQKNLRRRYNKYKTEAVLLFPIPHLFLNRKPELRSSKIVRRRTSAFVSNQTPTNLEHQ